MLRSQIRYSIRIINSDCPIYTQYPFFLFDDSGSSPRHGFIVPSYINVEGSGSLHPEHTASALTDADTAGRVR